MVRANLPIDAPRGASDSSGGQGHKAIAVVRDASDLTAPWLTATLQATGVLTDGTVRMLDVTLWHGKTHSDLYRLHATYDGRTDGLPTRFVCKVSRSGAATSTARRRRWKEHEFYASLYPAMPDAPVPRAFSTVFDDVSERSHLLLEDLSESHVRPPTPLPPTPDQLRGDVDCLAQIHSRWWAHQDLSGVLAERHARWIRNRSAATRRNLARFLAEYGEHVPAAMLTALEQAAEASPVILRRSAEAPLTVVHGDAHPWNFLTPRAVSDAETRLLDWEGWSTEPGPHDLASLLALHVPPFVRRDLEAELLERYVERLRDAGVAYDLSECWFDYRLAVARRMLAPVGMWSRGSQARSWWPILERVSTAFHELRCEEALSRQNAAPAD